MSVSATQKRIVIGIFVALALVVFVPLVGLAILFSGGSERTIYQREKSPDGWHEARVQFDDAGAVSGFSRLVFVKHAWNGSDDPLLSCRAFWGEGQSDVNLSWIDSRTLLIRHHFAPQNVEAVAKNCGPVRIIAKPVPPYESYR